MKSAALRPVLVAALALAPGCSPADVSDPFTQLCTDYAFAYCQHLQSCSATATQTRYGSANVCGAMQKASCLTTARAPHTGTTPDTLTACNQALSSWACQDFVESQNPPPGCQTVMGPLPDGAACAVRSECQSGFCSTVPGQNCGTCGPPAAAGASCSESNCVVGYACTGTPPVCQAYALMGAPCGTTIPCEVGLVCAGGICQIAPGTLNAPCSVAAGCDFNAGLACNAMSNTCKPVRLSPPGGPCGTVNGQNASCLASTCIHGMCAANPPLGAACDINGANCMTPGHCVVDDGGTTGTCLLHGATACPGDSP